MSLFLAALLFQAEPAAATTPVPPVASHEDCADPAKRTALLGSDPEQMPAFQAMSERATANERKMTALVDKLAERAKWTSERKAEFAMGLLSAPELSGPLQEGFTLIGRVTELVEGILESEDETVNCRAVVDMMGLLPRIEANANLQWGVMEALVQAEAKALNVPLD